MNLCEQVEGDSQEDITESFDIQSVPTFIILRVSYLQFCDF